MVYYRNRTNLEFSIVYGIQLTWNAATTSAMIAIQIPIQNLNARNSNSWLLAKFHRASSKRRTGPVTPGKVNLCNIFHLGTVN